MNRIIFTSIFFSLLFLGSCAVLRKEKTVKDCEEKQITSGEISNVLVEVKNDPRVNVYGEVVENGKPVTAGIIFFKNDITGITTNEFISTQFSVSLTSGLYTIKISGDSNLEYDLGKLKFEEGEVRKLDFKLTGHVLFIERTTYNRKSGGRN